MFGEPKQLTLDYCVLPTYEDIMKRYLWVHFNLKSDNWNWETTFSEKSQFVTDTIKNICHRASIPIVFDAHI